MGASPAVTKTMRKPKNGTDMTNVQDSKPATLPDQFYHFHRMIEARKDQIEPKWNKGFGRGSFPFVVGLFLLIMAWATWGRESYGEQEVSPALMLISGTALAAYGLSQREVLVRVPLYGVVVDGRAEEITWADKWSMEHSRANRDAMLRDWQGRYPGSVVELNEVGSAWVYVPRSLVERAGSSTLASR